MAKRRRAGGGRGRGGSVNPLKAVLVTGTVLLCLLAAGLLGLRAGVQSWLRGEGFRAWLAARASAALQSEVDFSEPRWRGSEVAVDRFRALGRDGAGFAELSLDGSSAKLGGIQDGALTVPEIRVNRLDLRFSGQRPGGGAAAPEAVPGAPRWLSRFLPDRVETGEAEILSASLEVRDLAGAETVRMGPSALRVLPGQSDGMWRVSGRGGRLLLSGVPELDIKQFAFRWRGDSLFIDRCALGVFRDGHVEGRGEIEFGGPGGPELDLDLQLSSLRVEDLVSEQWRGRLSGTVDGPVRVRGPAGAAVQEGSLSVSGGEVRSLPLLERIADYTRAEQFRRLALSEASFDFRKEGDSLDLRNLVLQSDGLVRVEGSVDVRGEEISGDLAVGVTPGTLRWLPGAERHVFTESRGGYLWTPLQLAGTVSEPREDLSGRLLLAARRTVTEDIPSDLADEVRRVIGGEGAPGEGGSAPDRLLESGRRAFDLFAPLLRSP